MKLCNICGRELKSLGYARHMAMHRDAQLNKSKENSGLIERAFVAGRSKMSWEQFKKDNGL